MSKTPNPQDIKAAAAALRASQQDQSSNGQSAQSAAPDTTNVGNEPQKSIGASQQRRVTAATRIPMSAPTQQLAVPEIEGYHLHWHLGANVPRAKQAGYTHVTDEDGIDVVGRGVANSGSDIGSTDLGSIISILSGTSNNNEEPDRLYLMKIPQEWWEEDQKNLQSRNDQIAASIRGGTLGADKEDGADRSRRYMKQGQDLFWPKSNRK